jgi:hypothetical protein
MGRVREKRGGGKKKNGEKERKKKRPASPEPRESSAIGAEEGGIGHWTEVEDECRASRKVQLP